ncbi:MAG: sigma 54-dependent Fis family transcriptional regulator [Polyangiaceae bacterium]|nr:sigma 54-dependent Fis family transcriptional regulator [Polyangiaceae bacterium]
MRSSPPRASDGTLTDVRLDVVELPNLRLVVTPPRGRRVEVPLGMTPVVLGSDPECDVVIDDARVSRKHCEVRRDARGVVVRDLGSKNGTYVDKVLVAEAYLDPKLGITVGSTRIALEASSGSAKVALSRAFRFGDALGASVAMRALFANLERAAQTDETIVLMGESGTGKELLAKGIHDVSHRRGGPFVVFDCSAVAPSLVEAELFGYVRGAFTGALQPHAGVFEQANGGTLFIDELGELPSELQPKLLRALEARQVRRLGATEWQRVDVRIVAATHRDLRARVSTGQFREDLYYRLAVVEAHIPPLRDRREDIPLLVEHFLAGMSPPRAWSDLPPNAAELLRHHDWPGNIRELRNTVARLILFPASGAPSSAPQQRPTPFDGAAQANALLNLPLSEARAVMVDGFERAYIAAKLNEHAGNVSRAAQAMGVSRQFLHRLLDRYGIRRE